jgi:hypothetical protein
MNPLTTKILDSAKELIAIVDPSLENPVVTGAVIVIEVANSNGEAIFTLSTRMDVPWYTLGLLQAGQVFAATALTGMASLAFHKNHEEDPDDESE